MNNMQYTHTQKNAGHAPRKLRLVADMIRKMTPEQAIESLSFAQRAAAPDLAKAIKTALANAGNKANLSFEKIEINEGLKMKRYRPAARGRMRPYVKKMSHIKIVLTDEGKAVAAKPMKSRKSEVMEAEKVEVK